MLRPISRLIFRKTGWFDASKTSPTFDFAHEYHSDRDESRKSK